MTVRMQWTSGDLREKWKSESLEKERHFLCRQNLGVQYFTPCKGVLMFYKKNFKFFVLKFNFKLFCAKILKDYFNNTIAQKIYFIVFQIMLRFLCEVQFVFYSKSYNGIAATNINTHCTYQTNQQNGSCHQKPDKFYAITQMHTTLNMYAFKRNKHNNRSNLLRLHIYFFLI